MLRTTVVVIHAAAGICGLLAGLAAIAPPRPADDRAWLRSLYLICLTVVLVTLVVLVAADWNSLDAGARSAFGGLTGLAAVMVHRLTRAYEVSGTQGAGWREQYIGHISFTYVALWEGFVILPALRLPYPQLTVPLVAIAVLIVASTLIERYKARVLAVPSHRATRFEHNADGHHPDRPRHQTP